MPSTSAKAKTEVPTYPRLEHHTAALAEAAPRPAGLEGMPSVKAARMDLLPEYLASKINAFNANLRQRGVDVIDLGMGNPIDPVAPNVIQALKDALDVPANHRYAPATGIPPLKEAFSRHYARHFGVNLDPNKEIISSIGSKDAFSHLCLALLGPQDACVTPTPAYAPHYYSPLISGSNMVGVFMTEHEPGRALLDGIKHAFEMVRPKPKFLILNFPHNPTARTVDLEFFEEIIAMARRLKFWVLNDLAYGHTCFDGYKAPSILQPKGARDVAVEMFTMSKPYNMAGWRVGFLAGNAQIIDSLSRIKPYFDYGHFQALQVATAVALDTGDECIKQQALIYKRRRDVMLRGLEQAGWGKLQKQRATMFTWQAIPERYGALGTIKFCEQLAEHAGVSFFPGRGFGHDGEGFVRIALVEPDELLAEACRRIGEFLKE